MINYSLLGERRKCKNYNGYGLDLCACSECIDKNYPVDKVAKENLIDLNEQHAECYKKYPWRYDFHDKSK